jgi:hypothetical protein
MLASTSALSRGLRVLFMLLLGAADAGCLRERTVFEQTTTLAAAGGQPGSDCAGAADGLDAPVTTAPVTGEAGAENAVGSPPCAP